jgi:hypothetical protein
MTKLTADQIRRIRFLYTGMPGAEPPPFHNGEPQWGDVEGSREWAFCEAVVRMTDETVGRSVNALASAHDLV